MIGTRGNGISDAVKDGFNGILVDQNNDVQTADAIVMIITDKDKQRRMSENSYLWAREHDIGRMVVKYTVL